MTILRELYWLWIVVGMVLSALLIAFLFIIINKCISKKAGEYQPDSSNFYVGSGPYHPRDIGNEVPPLPPRDMSISSDSVNQYETVDNLPEYLKVVEDHNAQVVSNNPDNPKSKEAEINQDNASDMDYDDVMAPPGYDSDDYDDVG